MDPRPWRRPLAERQVYIDALNEWPDKEVQRRQLQALVYGVQSQDSALAEAQIYRPIDSKNSREGMTLQVRGADCDWCSYIMLVIS